MQQIIKLLKLKWLIFVDYTTFLTKFAIDFQEKEKKNMHRDMKMK